MRIVKEAQMWRVLGPGKEWSCSLEVMTHRAGYRIGELCQELECSERYLHQVFKRDIGQPPKVWMRTERMVVARRLLVDGKRPHEVGELLGFGTLDGFRREFQLFYRIKIGDMKNPESRAQRRGRDREELRMENPDARIQR